MKTETATKKDVKIAIVHDFLLYPGGAERVVEQIAAIYPDAPIYTLLYNPDGMKGILADREIRTSFLQKWPSFLRKRHRWLLPFYGPAVESLDLRDFDVVISSSGAWSKGVVTRLNTHHIAYIHSPMRYVWDENEKYMRSIVKKSRFFTRMLLSYIRVWDFQAAQRPDILLANSHFTRDRIANYYRREADVLYPPVSAEAQLENVADKDDLIGSANHEKPFLIIARLVAYKRVGLAIDVCNKLQLPLIVVGQGPLRKQLEKRAGKTVKFVGYVNEKEKGEILRGARALLFPSEEDFGIVCVEALYAGVPVIALGRGAAPEMIVPREHGVLFERPTTEVMADGIRRFLVCEQNLSRSKLRERAVLFAGKSFGATLAKHINKDDLSS